MLIICFATALRQASMKLHLDRKQASANSGRSWWNATLNRKVSDMFLSRCACSTAINIMLYAFQFRIVVLLAHVALGLCSPGPTKKAFLKIGWMSRKLSWDKRSLGTSLNYVTCKRGDKSSTLMRMCGQVSFFFF